MEAKGDDRKDGSSAFRFYRSYRYFQTEDENI